MAQKMQVEKQFTRGNLISIIATLLTGVFMFAGGLTAFNRTDAKTVKNEQSITRLESDMDQAQLSIQSLQVSNARTVAQFDALSRSLDEVKLGLREISSILRDDRGRQ